MFRRKIRYWFGGILAAIFAIFAPQLFSEDNNLSWQHDGVDLAGFYVYHAANGGDFSRIATITNSAARTYLHPNQTDGTHCYQVTAFDVDLNESDPSNTACKTIDTLAPNPPTNLAVN